MLKLATVLLAVQCATSLRVFDRSYHSNDADSHFRFGFEMGAEFRSDVHARANSTTMTDKVLPFVNSTGADTFLTLMERHQTKYPLYFEELKGIASGTGLEFHVVFAMNLIQELKIMINEQSAHKLAYDDQCSDYAVQNTTTAFITHNEDSGLNDIDHTFLAKVSFGDKRFIAYTYCGDLPTGAFGFVPKEFAFTLNLVPPSSADLSHGGVGRGFVSRALLDAESYYVARNVAMDTYMIGGHNYQILSLREAAVCEIEVYHNEHTHLVDVKVGDAQFHANSYVYLDVNQTTDWGSLARVQRASEMPIPTDATLAFNVLGDQANSSYPVFHDALAQKNGDKTGLWTLNSVLFDFTSRKMTIYKGNPKEKNVEYEMSLE